MIALAQKIKRLKDDTVRAFLRLEDPDLDQPVVVSVSIWKGDIFLVERVEKAPDTAKIPVPFIEMSPSLLLNSVGSSTA